ncbi:type I-E CRISPR-associated protein Cas6/Cse3/CasE [Arsenicicoccus dermatophilus]|uniref:type I-E CRISPR-associated protein Cas6/Cse3/CasE n=1 Tax=Arsenicicoccus dermatophilus TaxID=1076331 RepID=UPI001F4CA223|nr:type I-E CRISPR-associated protein Cas6/Cse3/CasE [Arsenicicoccus dermatophilus]MCH8611568.1 type I-E CRISPR-associated protein Cas6/Cse3/CasE [Arsenicicoccus dermatophilus]
MTEAPFWTVFPTHAVKTDWTDHGESHRAVMRLFERELPGAAHERRATGQILYRVDHHLDGSSTVLVQSRHALETAPPQARATTIPRGGWDLAAGTPVLFRVAVNAVRRRTERDDAGRRRESLSTLAPDEVPEWVSAKVSDALTLDEVFGHTRRTHHHRRHRDRTPPRFVVDTVDGLATVADAAALQQLRLDGVGRGKAYGAGLLTVRPLG